MKEHFTLQGLQKIINIRATLNYGLSKECMLPETVPVPRPLRETCVILHSQWIAGFTSAEGNFSISSIFFLFILIKKEGQRYL